MDIQFFEIQFHEKPRKTLKKTMTKIMNIIDGYPSMNILFGPLLTAPLPKKVVCGTPKKYRVRPIGMGTPSFFKRQPKTTNKLDGKHWKTMKNHDLARVGKKLLNPMKSHQIL